MTHGSSHKVFFGGERGSKMAMFDIYLYLEPVCVLSSTYFSGGALTSTRLGTWNQASSKALNLSGFQVSSLKLKAKAPQKMEAIPKGN